MDLKPVVSQHIAAVGYDPEAQAMQVVFNNGATYRYKDVPPEIYEEMMDAPSVGQFHALQIRGKFEHQKLTNPGTDDPRSEDVLQ